MEDKDEQKNTESHKYLKAGSSEQVEGKKGRSKERKK